MGKFRCGKCNYQFEIEMETLPRLCPNCGEKGSVNRELSADELINDI
ncbi:MAG: rubredoxin [Candidatus Pacearchaeota archaeon]